MPSQPHWFARDASDASAAAGIGRATAATLWVVLALAGGCATSAGPESGEASARITAFREPSPRDSVFPMLFAIDGRPVAQLYPKEIVTLEIPAGEHRFEYELGVYHCAAGVRIEPGEHAVYRLAQGCVIAPAEPVSESAAAGAESARAREITAEKPKE